mmetsp:Transcript_90938/g.208268  ORF Transcript_90938/g.208268 Transcript_90938/m.208268 type:complete len:225 (-) Transcript_90938:166-840(-)
MGQDNLRSLLLLQVLWDPTWDIVQLESKQVHHGDLVQNLQPGHCRRVHGLEAQHHHCVKQTGPELRNLPSRHQLLERITQSERGPQVVAVHDHVSHGIHPRSVGRGPVAIAGEDQESPHHADRAVVVHVQEGQLGPPLAQDDEQCVKPVQVLGQVVHKHHPLIVGGEIRVDSEGVHHVGQQSPGHIQAHHDLDYVVDLHGLLGVHRALSLHVVHPPVHSSKVAS